MIVLLLTSFRYRDMGDEVRVVLHGDELRFSHVSADHAIVVLLFSERCKQKEMQINLPN